MFIVELYLNTFEVMFIKMFHIVTYFIFIKRVVFFIVLYVNIGQFRFVKMLYVL